MTDREGSHLLGNWSKRLGIAALLAGTALAGCEKDVILEGERFPVRAPLEDSVAVEGQPAPVAADPKAGYGSAPISLPGQQANADWPQRGGNAAHTGLHGALSAAPVRVWSASVGAGNAKRARVTAAPVVAGGRVFAMDAGKRVVALGLGGALQWEASLLPEFDSGSDVVGGGLAAAGGSVFASTAYGEVIAFDAGTGAVKWRQRLDGPVAGAPSVEGGTVYVVARDGTGTALDAANGKIRWQVTGVRSGSGVISPAAPAVTGDAVIIPFASGQVMAVAREDGARQWLGAVAGQRNGRAYAGVGDVTGDPVIAGGVAYVGSASGRTVAIDVADGKRIWTATEGAMNPPLVVGGSVFVVNDEARLVRMDAATGDVIWATDMPYYDKEKVKNHKAITAHYGPVLAGGRLAVVSSDGQLRLFSPVDGSLIGGAEIPGGAASAPALAGGMLLVMGGNGQIHAFR